LSAVAVCETVPELVHRTGVLFAIVIVSGLN